MANHIEIPLWFPEDKLSALSAALEPTGSSVVKELESALEALYQRVVPEEKRIAIAEALAQEQQREAEERARQAAESYRVSALKLTVGRTYEYIKLTRAWDILSMAAFTRETLRKAPSSPSDDFRARLGEIERLTDRDFAELALARFQNDPHVNGVFQVSFATKGFSFIVPGEGWRDYGFKDISAAVYKAERKSGLSHQEKLHRFFDALTGKLYFTWNIEWKGDCGDA